MRCGPLLCLALFLAGVALSDSRRLRRQVNGNPAFFCYYATWAKYGRLRPEAIDPFICTHIVVAFAEVKVNSVTADIQAFDQTDENDVFPAMSGLKTRNPNLKMILAVGGWNHGTNRFIRVADNPALLNSFVKNTVNYLKRFQFDGLDVDWEFPTSKSQFSRFIRALRTEFNQPGNSHLILTSAMSAGEAAIISGYDIPDLAITLDYVLLMSYDLHGGWEGKTGHNSPLFARSTEVSWRARLNTAWAANEWFRKGMPRSKIIIGMTTYARRFTLRDPAVHGVEAPAEWWNVILNYAEVCSEFLPGSTIVWDAESQAHYAYKGKLWLSFDSVDSIRAKTKWLMQNRFGGAMVWTMDQDDYSDKCGQGFNPLLSTIKQELFGDNGVTVSPFPGQLSTVTANPGGGTPPTTRPTSTTTTRRIITQGSVDCSVDPPGDYPITGECSAFIKCANGQEFIFLCQDTLFYDPELSRCDFEKNVKPKRSDCPWSSSARTATTTTQSPRATTRRNRANTTTLRPRTTARQDRVTTTTRRATTTTLAGQVDCSVVSPGNHIFRGDCTRFFQCANGFLFVNVCPPGLLYDSISDRCDWPFLVKEKRSDCV
ncbi:chitinase-3-like protein 1 [Liolophura sinensis]|uniref:chitinase-3-like protein 1 n=1 Tax=Liolophura sinensis TaxID=3198878 RepID=UPI0031583D25